MHLQKCQLQQNNALTQIKTFDGCMKYPHGEKGRLKDGQGSNHSGSSYSCTQKFIAACKIFGSVQEGQSMLQRSASEMQFSSEQKCKSTSDAVQFTIDQCIRKVWTEQDAADIQVQLLDAGAAAQNQCFRSFLMTRNMSPPTILLHTQKFSSLT